MILKPSCWLLVPWRSCSPWQPAVARRRQLEQYHAAAAPSGGGETLKLSADPTKLAFNTKTLSAKSGTVTLTMANPSGIPHAIAVEGNGVDKNGQTVQQGGTSTITVNLKPGKYTFYCPVDGHRAAGMEGTLTVS